VRNLGVASVSIAPGNGVKMPVDYRIEFTPAWSQVHSIAKFLENSPTGLHILGSDGFQDPCRKSPTPSVSPNQL